MKSLQLVRLREDCITFVSDIGEVTGRVASVRTAGSKLAFVDLLDHSDDERLQIVVNNGQLDACDPLVNHVKAFTKLIQRGDIVCAYCPDLAASKTDPSSRHRSTSLHQNRRIIDPRISTPSIADSMSPSDTNDSLWRRFRPRT